ncbi:hypothetical protein BGY98DRAFT_1096703 [Russula aff. rugulosa BPL654]|nr:hypothetical protein BGY98DRAFT_1096703 [Russula aff. rugulosa BPL654]
MSYLLQSTESIDQGAISPKSQQKSPHTTSIHILDDYSLLNVFYLYRPRLSGEHEDIKTHIESGRPWDNGHWWFKLTHVCRRWRGLVLGSASHLGLCLVCTNGTPVGDMLIHAPPLPLVIDYHCFDGGLFEGDEEEIILALEQRERVRYIRFIIPLSNLRKLIMAIDEEYPTLEYLDLSRPNSEDDKVALILPKTLQAPRLRHLLLYLIAPPIGSRLLITAVGLVSLEIIHPPYIHPAVLLQWLPFLPQLENLVYFTLPVPNRDVERQLIQTPITTHITLPNLCSFAVEGPSAYLEALFRRITAHRLETLEIGFFKQLTFYVPRLLQFMNTTENFRFDRVEFEFDDERVFVGVYPLEAETAAFSINVKCRHLDWQVTSVAQIFNALSQMFSTVEHLTFEHEAHSQSSEEHNEVDRTEWRKLLRSFRNVKTLSIENGLIEELSRCLSLEDGEHPLEVLPELQELTYSGSGKAGDKFTSFIDSRRNADRPVTLIRS